MHGSPHDDRVMSFAIANQMLKHVWLPEYRVESIAPKYSLDWFSDHIVREEKQKFVIGSFNTRKVTI
jgi:hypothetical protein